MRLSESLEDYLEAIALLIASEGHAHTKEIAERMGVKMPSVTGALRQLKQLGYIDYNTHYPVTLTPEGKIIADQVLHRHEVLKKFFSDILGLLPEKASETACRIEHAVDENTVKSFMLFSEAIENRSDAKKLQVYLSEAIEYLNRSSDQDGSCKFCVLSDLPRGKTGTVDAIGRNLAECENLPLAPGDEVTLQKISLDKSSFTVDIENNRSIALSNTVAENIWIKY